jgi:predicted MFS family arabinose efflux permease
MLSFGAAAGSFCEYGIAFWVPAPLQRCFGLTLVESGQFMGVQLLITGVAGVYAGGWLGDRLGHGDKAGYARVAAAAYALSSVLLALAFTSNSVFWFFLMMLIPGGLISAWIAPVVTAVQHLVPATDRATASACFLLINNGIGLGFGSLGVGLLSDGLAPIYGAEALRYALIAVSLLYVMATACMLLAAPCLRRGWIA